MPIFIVNVCIKKLQKIRRNNLTDTVLARSSVINIIAPTRKIDKLTEKLSSTYDLSNCINAIFVKIYFTYAVYLQSFYHYILWNLIWSPPLNFTVERFSIFGVKNKVKTVFTLIIRFPVPSVHGTFLITKIIKINEIM